MAITKISDLLQSKALPDKVEQQKPKPLTPVQITIGSLTFPQLVSDWSGTAAQITAGQMALSEIVQREDLPTLADVNRVHGNIASIAIIAEHLISVCRFAGVDLTQDQAKETALVILSGYYYLNLAELALFFHHLKCGERGQVVYGKKINNQAIMCALHDFAAERRQKIDRMLAEKAQAESLERRAADFVGAIQNGISGHYDKCHEDFDYFLKAFPFLVGSPHASAWWEHFKKDREKALKDIWALTKPTKPKSGDLSNDNLKNESNHKPNKNPATGLNSSPTTTKRINLMKQVLTEHWLPLNHCAKHPDGNPFYEVSNLGNIRKKTAAGYRDIKPYTNPDGYRVVRLKNAIMAVQSFYLHRLVAVCFRANPGGYDTVDHIDGDKSNNCSRNLQWVSRATNISKGHEDGSIRRQFPRHPVKLTKENREMCFETMARAAAFLECSLHAVQAAKNGHYRIKGWKVESLMKPEINGNIFTDEDFE